MSDANSFASFTLLWNVITRDAFVFLDRLLNGELVRNPFDADHVAVDQRETVSKSEIVDLLLVDQRYDDLVAAYDPRLRRSLNVNV